MTASRPQAFWPALWLIPALVLAKATHWNFPPTRWTFFAADMLASTHADLLFACALGVIGAAALASTRRAPRLQRLVWRGFLALGVASVFFAVASVRIFAYMRAPLTYQLLYLAGDAKNMRSSLGSFVDVGLVTAFVAALAGYALAVRWSIRFEVRDAVQLAVLAGVVALALAGGRIAAGPWRDRDDRMIAESPHYAILASFARELLGGGAPSLEVAFPPAALADFEAPKSGSKLPPGRRPTNVILLVLESTGTRYLSLYGSPYDTMPNLVAESAHARVYENFYCHVGLTANSMAALTLSIYPYMTWREYTQDYPDYPGVTLANLVKAAGHRTAFIQSGRLDYVGERAFMRTRGFDALWDLPVLTSEPALTSWGGEDRFAVDGVLRFIDQQPQTPFYILSWTIQSHHPYEPSPDQKLVDFFQGRTLPPDDYDLGRYLNTLREVDRQLARLFAGLRQRGMADTTLVAITGDHGEAFGDPHPTWGHGARIFEENVHVPLMLWAPGLFHEAERDATVGSHVDLNPTLADLVGVQAPPAWEGHSLFATARPPRAYFYAANDDYLLGVREGRFKYIYNATLGRDDLFDLEADPDESRNVAAGHAAQCKELRERLSAWRDHAGRALERARQKTR